MDVCPFFSNASIQLFPITCQPIRVFNFFWNLTLVGLATPRMFALLTASHHYTVRDASLGVAIHEKPLFAILINFFVPYFYNFAFFANILYFLALNWNNSRLIHLLDSLAPQHFLNQRASTKLFSYLMIAHHLLFLTTIWPAIVFYSSGGEYLKLGKHYLVTLILYINFYTPFTLLLYGKYATLLILRELKENFALTPNVLALQTELAQLARSNELLHRIVAFPFLTMGISFTVHLLITISTYLLSLPKSLNLYLLTFILLLPSICYLDKRIQWQLNRITEEISHFHNGIRTSSSSFQSSSFRHLVFLSLYRPYFTFRIFNLLDINFAFLFVLLLFVLNYLVLLFQTST